MLSRGRMGGSSKLAARNHKNHLNLSLGNLYTGGGGGVDRHNSVNSYDSQIMKK